MAKKVEEITLANQNLGKIGKRTIKINAELYYFEKKELEQLKKIFSAWIKLKDEILMLSSRKPNLHEVISEGALSYFMKCPRIVQFIPKKLQRSSPEFKKRTEEKKRLAKKLYGAKKIGDLDSKSKKDLNVFLGYDGPSHSFDCYDTKSHETLQIKATVGSNDPNEEDLTSFDPYDKTVGLKFQKLYFLDFRTLDGKFFVYDIPLNELLKVQINKKQTFEQTSKIRPRFSIFKHLISKFSIQPIAVYDLMKP